MDQRQPAVIVDVDGTLCDVSGIRHYVAADPRNRNFDLFHRASALCPAIPGTLAWVEREHALGRAVLVVIALWRREGIPVTVVPGWAHPADGAEFSPRAP